MRFLPGRSTMAAPSKILSFKLPALALLFSLPSLHPPQWRGASAHASPSSSPCIPACAPSAASLSMTRHHSPSLVSPRPVIEPAHGASGMLPPLLRWAGSIRSNLGRVGRESMLFALRSVGRPRLHTYGAWGAWGRSVDPTRSIRGITLTYQRRGLPPACRGVSRAT